MSSKPALTQERRDFVEQMMLAFVPPRVIAKQASERFGCQRATIFKDMKVIEKNWDRESTLLQDKDEWQRLKHQHIKSIQLAMHATLAAKNYSQYTRLSETYIKLMGFSKNGAEVKHVIQQQKEAVSKMSEEELAKLIKEAGVELH